MSIPGILCIALLFPSGTIARIRALWMFTQRYSADDPTSRTTVVGWPYQNPPPVETPRPPCSYHNVRGSVPVRPSRFDRYCLRVDVVSSPTVRHDRVIRRD